MGKAVSMMTCKREVIIDSVKVTQDFVSLPYSPSFQLGKTKIYTYNGGKVLVTPIKFYHN